MKTRSRRVKASISFYWLSEWGIVTNRRKQ
nr:MAG TPA: hypothetical protein [Caudoviricetes sp.]